VRLLRIAGFWGEPRPTKAFAAMALHEFGTSSEIEHWASARRSQTHRIQNCARDRFEPVPPYVRSVLGGPTQTGLNRRYFRVGKIFTAWPFLITPNSGVHRTIKVYNNCIPGVSSWLQKRTSISSLHSRTVIPLQVHFLAVSPLSLNPVISIHKMFVLGKTNP
jgi:hypothetical protein